jgi:outer membrane murein-binding lipoprotein Lpp
VHELSTHLASLQAERDQLKQDVEALKLKHRQKRKVWADDRAKLVRCLEAQTRANTTHLQDIARQIGPGGSLRQSLDAAISRTSSFPHAVRYHGERLIGKPSTQAASSMCSSPLGSAVSAPFCPEVRAMKVPVTLVRRQSLRQREAPA